MKRTWYTSVLIAAGLVLAAAATLPAADNNGFESLFNGKDLDGWDGNPDFWSVKDGVITGQTTAEKPTNGNTFLIYRKGDVADFELRLKFRIVGGNSGVQYRSREVAKWVIAGYQADFDAAGAWTGTLYEEKARGVLAKRGAKVEITAEGEKKVIGTTTPESEIVESIKKEGWNEYTIVARGNHLVQSVNGKVTADVTDHQESKRAASGLLALQLHAGPPMLVQFKDIEIKRLSPDAGGGGAKANCGEEEEEEDDDSAASASTGQKKVVFVAGPKSHGYGAHEHYAGCVLLANALKASGLGIDAVVYKDGWPQDAKAFDGADAVVMYCDGGGGHFANKHLPEIDALASKGVGVVCIHYGVEVPKGDPGDRFLNWIGGYFETFWSVNPHWTPTFDKLPQHAITAGVKPFTINDEWYYHMRFRPEMASVTPILTALPPDSTLSRADGPHSGNEFVRAEVAKGIPQHVAWAAERPGGGRGFGFTGGHDHWNWGNDNFRKLVLNAIAWAAHVDVPAGGVPSTPLTVTDLEANQDEPQPQGFDRSRIEKMLAEWN